MELQTVKTLNAYTQVFPYFFIVVWKQHIELIIYDEKAELPLSPFSGA